jgi:hypothetical protein
LTKPTAAAPTPQAWDGDALLKKAHRYVEEMLQLQRDDWKFALWSSLALELLIRSTLAKISPTLLADPREWSNLYFSLGFTPNAKKFVPKSIGTADVLGRLRDIIPEFDTELEGFCASHANRRNAELHSGEIPFDGIKDSSWLPSYYRSCKVLLGTMSISLADFFGKEEGAVAEKLIEAAADVAAKAAVGTAEAHRKVWEAKPPEEQAKRQAQAAVWATQHAGHRVDCPACGSVGLVIGDPIAAPQKTIKEDLIKETQQYLPNKFACIACGLKLTGLSHLSACGLGDAYTQTQEYDAAEYYAPDEEPEWEPDNNE